MLESGRFTGFEKYKRREIRMQIQGIADLKRFQKFLVVLVDFHYRSTLNVITVVAFLFVVDIKVEKAGDFFNIPLQGSDGVTGDLGILKFEGAQQILFQLCISCRRAFQSLNNKGIAGKIEIFFSWGYVCFMVTPNLHDH